MRIRIIFLVVLFLLPFAFLTGVGFYHLWKTGWLFWAWWPMACSFAAAYILAWRWQKGLSRRAAEEPPPGHHTERDVRAAQSVIDKYINRTENVNVESITGAQLYVDVAQDMAAEIAAIYHPNSKDPLGGLTIPEILAVIELAAHDLGIEARESLPGGHLVTINNVRQAQSAMKWYQRGNQAMWAVSAVLDPVRTGLRYAASQAGLGKLVDLAKQISFLWFYKKFVRKLGFYLIELYSGRLKVGVERYQELQREREASRPIGGGDTIVLDGQADKARAVSIAIIGQVKAGKSSLINALLGERRAVTDVIPATSGVSRYELRAADGSRLILLDTVGYNQTGPAADQLDETIEAAREADLIFFVAHARNPAREADLKVWQELKDSFTDRPELKMPPVVVVLTHIDLLSPALEWSPPYDWRNPARPKEQSIAEAVAAAGEQFGAGISALVPVCAAENKLAGVAEELIPEMTGLLGEARAVAFLRCLHAEADERQLQKIFQQALAAGKALLFQALRK